jgi:hypothetical protein
MLPSSSIHQQYYRHQFLLDQLDQLDLLRQSDLLRLTLRLLHQLAL